MNNMLVLLKINGLELRKEVRNITFVANNFGAYKHENSTQRILFLPFGKTELDKEGVAIYLSKEVTEKLIEKLRELIK